MLQGRISRVCPLNEGSARYLPCVWVVLEVGEGSLENLHFVEVHLYVPMPVRDIVMQFPASCSPCFQGKNSNLLIGITSVGPLLNFRMALANGGAVVLSEGGVAVVAPYNHVCNTLIEIRKIWFTRYISFKGVSFATKGKSGTFKLYMTKSNTSR